MLILSLGGCGSDQRMLESTVAYEVPLEHRVVIETVVALPFEATWDGLIRRLSESRFRVATLEKASRFVDVQLDLSSDLAATANQPGRYVDCGRTMRTLSVDGREERFEYEVVESSLHRKSDVLENGYRLSEVKRRVELEARASIYLQPEGKSRTRVTVNARYRVEIEISGSATSIPLDPKQAPSAARFFGPRTESVRFSTVKPGRDARRGGLTCRATGAFEHGLIALANPAAAF
ncbi:MAG: hypothetical protein V3T64_00265 [Myxococcota bacterium]